MTILEYILTTVEALLLLYLGVASLYVLLFAVAGLFRRKVLSHSGTKNNIAVLIPGYKEDEVIVQVARNALAQKYGSAYYDVFIIADSFKKSTLKSLNELAVKVIEVSFDRSTKSKALNMALQQIDTHYDIALILDADNVMAPGFLEKINAGFNRGFKVVQGRRVAKNSNTSFAILDGLSEAINNHIFRQGHRALGLSSGLIGSGMAFDFRFFKGLMHEIKAVGGFDKELEFRLFGNGIKVEYLQDAVVYDEKIQQLGDFKKQRRRWLSTNSVYFGKFFRTSIRQLFFKGNIDMADKLYQMTMPPRLLLLGGVLAIAAVRFAFELVASRDLFVIPADVWYIILAALIISFAVATPQGYYNKATLRAALTAPKAFLVMFSLLFKLKGANKVFIHTKHSSITNSQG